MAPVSVAAPSPAATGAAGGASPQATAPVAASARPSTGGFIQADPSTNSLIITAAEPLYRQMRAVIDQLDSRRAQVYIEIDDRRGGRRARRPTSASSGRACSGKNGDSTLVGAGTNFGTSGNIIAVGSDRQGQRHGVTRRDGGALGDGLNIGVAQQDRRHLHAWARWRSSCETNTDTNILSTPNLMTLDNEEAKIVVGQNVPVRHRQLHQHRHRQATNPFQTIERKDVGLTLRIKPQIGEGGTVRMTIFQENSSVVGGAPAARTPARPPTRARSRPPSSSTTARSWCWAA